MPRLTFWTESNRSYIVLAVAVIASSVLLALGDSQKTFVAKAATITVLAPVQKGVSLINQYWGLRSQNQQLRQLNTELALENQFLREAKLENVRLRQLLSFREKEEFTDILLAEVIAREPDRQMNSITIGAGWRRGVKENLAVVTSQGLVGKVVDVLANSSIVLLLRDRNCPVSAMIQRSRVSGILSYEEESSFQLENVLWRMDVREGDEVISSGLGDIYPKGLRIGRVTRVRSDESKMFQQISVESFVDFNSLEEVFVILRFPQEPETEAEP
jgi:rod shape-determining protein MreC